MPSLPVKKNFKNMDSMPSLQIIRGLPFRKAPWFQKKNIEETLDYVPRDGDIIIASYPKAGSTWLLHIVQQIVSRGEQLPDFGDIITKVMPFLGANGVEAVENMKEPRIYKHHYPYNMVQKNEKTKHLYIYRNPADTFVSYYHFMKELREEAFDNDEFLKEFLKGYVGYGSMFKHVLSYFSHKEDENMLLISYEKLLLNRKQEISRIAKYLGEEYFRDLTNDESLLERIIEHTSFDYMKKHLFLSHPLPKKQSPGNTPQTVNFFRKGVAGEGKKTLSQYQLMKLREVIAEAMKGTELIDEWLKE